MLRKILVAISSGLGLGLYRTMLRNVLVAIAAGLGLRIISDNATKCTHCNEPHSVSSVSCTFKIIDGDNKITLVAFFLVKCYWSYNKHYFIFTDCDKEYSINISYQLYCDRCFCLLKQNVCFLFTDLKCA